MNRDGRWLPAPQTAFAVVRNDMLICVLKQASKRFFADHLCKGLIDCVYSYSIYFKSVNFETSGATCSEIA